jgi:hypothetical protein
MGMVGNWEKKKVRNCRQYKEGGRPTRVMGGEGGGGGGGGGGIQNLKSSINIIPEMYTLEEALREREREREKLYKYVLVMTQFEWEVLSQSETIWEGTKIMTLKKKKKTLSSSLPILTKSKEMHIKSMEKKLKNNKYIYYSLIAI